MRLGFPVADLFPAPPGVDDHDNGRRPTTTAPPPPSGPLQAGSPIALPFSADQVAAAESPDGAVFAAPQDPTSPSPSIAWVIDGNGPAEIAEHLPTGIAALAADGTNFYVATYSTLFAYNRQSGNQDGQWRMPPVPTSNSSNSDLVALAAANSSVFVSVTRGNTVSVYTVNPGTSAAPHLLLRGLGDAIGSDGSVYYERTDHRLVARRPNGATAVGPLLADTPNGSGGGVQYLEVVAGGAVWVSEPAGQGLDATYTTYDAATLNKLGSYNGTVTSTVVDSSAGALDPRGRRQRPGLPGGVAVDADLVRVQHRPAGRGQQPGGCRLGRDAHRPQPGGRGVRHQHGPVRPRTPVLTSQYGPDQAVLIPDQYDMETPPLGLSSCPVTKLLASEARYSTP